MYWFALWLLGCGSGSTYIVEGVVVDLSDGMVVVDHGPIEGFTGAMTTPFLVDDAAVLAELERGHRILGRLRVDGAHTELEKVRVVGKAPVPAPDVQPLEVGELLPATRIVLEDGTSAVIGEGQGAPTVVTFLYSRCPDADFCPATVQRLQVLQEQTEPPSRLIAITLDPDRDTIEVLTEHARAIGADPSVLRLARVDDLRTLAMRAALPIARSGSGEIVHEIRWLVLNADGRLVVRHDDNGWATDG